VQYSELVTQHRDFHIPRIASTTAAGHAEDLPEHKEREGPHHYESPSCQFASPLLTAARRRCTPQAMNPVRRLPAFTAPRHYGPDRADSTMTPFSCPTPSISKPRQMRE
jgi:hypothetical protein